MPFYGTYHNAPYNKSWGIPGKIAPTGGGGGGGIPKDTWIGTLKDGSSPTLLDSVLSGGAGGAISRQNPLPLRPVYLYKMNLSPGSVWINVENPSNTSHITNPKSVQAYDTFVGLGGYGGGWAPATDFSTSGGGLYGRSNVNYNETGTHWKPADGNKYGGGGGGGKAGIAGNHYYDDLKGSQAGARGAHGVVVIIQEG